eukprot:gene28126-49931_t
MFRRPFSNTSKATSVSYLLIVLQDKTSAPPDIYKMKTTTQKTPDLTRRSFLQRGGIAAALAAGIGPYLRLTPSAFANAGPATPFRFTPFTRPLPIPGRLAPAVLNPAPGSSAAAVGSPGVYHGIAP